MSENYEEWRVVVKWDAHPSYEIPDLYGLLFTEEEARRYATRMTVDPRDPGVRVERRTVTPWETA